MHDSHCKEPKPMQGQMTCAQSLPAAPRGVGMLLKVTTNHLNALLVCDSTLQER